MEQHPIPQNITGFEFKLIGDMTIKQFAYLASCVIVAYILFLINFIHPLIRIPLAVFFILLGIGLAFVPVQGRPLDRWILSFIKALFSPSQYVFHKDVPKPSFYDVQTKALKTNTPSQLVLKQDTRLQQYIQSISPSESFSAAPAPSFPIGQPIPSLSSPVTQPPKDMSSQQEINRIDAPQQQIQQPTSSWQTTISTSDGVSAPLPTPPNPQRLSQLAFTPVPFQQPVQEKSQIGTEVHEHVNKLYEENKKLREEIEAIKKSLSQQISSTPTIQLKQPTPQPDPVQPPSPITPPSPIPSAAPAPSFQTPLPSQSMPEGKAVTQATIVTPTRVVGLPQTPNLINGTVKDDKGEILPNIIVEVKDSTGNPVRAFKTNKLGQFSAATPLANGTYTVELEDPQKNYTFAISKFTLTGTISQPLEIQAKNTQVSQREQLRQSLFGSSV